MPSRQPTEILESIRAGDPRAAGELLPLVYAELRRLAARHLRGEQQGHTLEPTALVHEAYLKLFGGGPRGWEDRGHFFRAAAAAMRHILIDHARAKRGPKRGGSRGRVPLDLARLAAESDGDEILAVADAISRLELQSPDVAEVVRLRFFAGLSVEDTARALGVSERSVYRDWTYARAWLVRELG